MKREEAMKLAKEGFSQLSESVAEGKSESLVAFLKAMAQFSDYSCRNVLLILKQRPTATQVAGFRQWQKLGRQVRRGEKGIAILAPLAYKRQRDDAGSARGTEADEAADREVRGFRAVHVFDIAQTDGPPLPEIRCVAGDAEAWWPRLQQVVHAAGIKLVWEECLDGARGISRGGEVALLDGLDNTEAFYVLTHEYAHELLHKGEQRKRTDKRIRETEADAVAFVVASAVGLDGRDHAADYIQLYDGSVETLEESMHIIQKTAAKIITALHEQTPVQRAA